MSGSRWIFQASRPTPRASGLFVHITGGGFAWHSSEGPGIGERVGRATNAEFEDIRAASRQRP
jgi:hypothetical protein